MTVTPKEYTDKCKQLDEAIKYMRFLSIYLPVDASMSSPFTYQMINEITEFINKYDDTNS